MTTIYIIWTPTRLHYPARLRAGVKTSPQSLNCLQSLDCLQWQYSYWNCCAGQFRPLGVSSTVCEEDRGQSQSIYHGYKPAPLFEPVLSSPTQAAGIVQHSVAEELSFPSNHVYQLFEGETGVLRVLVDEYHASM